MVRVRGEWCTSPPSGPHSGAALHPCSRRATWLLCSGTATKNMSGTPGKTEATWWESLRPSPKERRSGREAELGRSTISRWLADAWGHGENTGLAGISRGLTGRQESRGEHKERFSHIFWRSASSVDLNWDSKSVSILTDAGGDDRWIPWPSLRVLVKAGAMPLSKLLML